MRLLALRAGQTVVVDSLVEALWPSVDLDRGRASLRTAASQVRSVLGQDHLARRTGGLVLTGVWVDALAFEALVSTAGQQLSAGHTAEAVRSAWEALGLYVADLGDGRAVRRVVRRRAGALPPAPAPAGAGRRGRRR